MKYANCFEGKYLMEKRNKSSVYEPPNKKIVVIFIIVLWLIIFLIVGIGVYRLQTTYEYEPKNIVTISAQEVYYPSAALSQVEVKFSVSGHKPDKLEANIEIVDAARNDLGINRTYKTTDIKNGDENTYIAYFSIKELITQDETYLVLINGDVKAYRTHLHTWLNK